MATLQVGLIGCGRIAQLVHLNELVAMPNVKLVAIAEPDAQRRQAAQQRVPSATACSHYQDLLALKSVEAVVICLPNDLHAETAVAALRQHKHVYLEKPLATTVAEGQAILSAWQHANTVGMIGFNYRHHRLFHAAREAIRTGELGALVSVRSVFSSGVQTLPGWQSAGPRDGRVLLDLASHHVDLVHFLFEQPVQEVFAQVRSQRSPSDSAMLHLQLADGLLVQSFFSLNTVAEDRFDIYGESGQLAVDRHRSLNLEITRSIHTYSRIQHMANGLRLFVRSPYLLDKLRAPQREPSYHSALQHFVTCIARGKKATPDFGDGLHSLAVIEAAEQSAHTGQIVGVTEQTGAHSPHQ